DRTHGPGFALARLGSLCTHWCTHLCRGCCVDDHHHWWCGSGECRRSIPHLPRERTELAHGGRLRGHLCCRDVIGECHAPRPQCSILVRPPRGDQAWSKRWQEAVTNQVGCACFRRHHSRTIDEPASAT